LPEQLRPLFWDHDFEKVDWLQHRDFIIGRVLEAGSWDAICWLRLEVGDGVLRDWFMRSRGRLLDSEQLRFWQVILDLPADAVDAWLQSPERKIWEQR
jgi:hypothetical protein